MRSLKRAYWRLWMDHEIAAVWISFAVPLVIVFALMAVFA